MCHVANAQTHLVKCHSNPHAVVGLCLCVCILWFECFCCYDLLQVRGATSPVDELSYILTQSGSSGLIVQDKATLRRLLPALSPGSTPPALKFVVVLWDDATDSSAESEKSAMLDQAGVAVLSYDQVLTKGRSLLSMGSLQPHKSRKHDLATIVYTSGTTGTISESGTAWYSMQCHGSAHQFDQQSMCKKHLDASFPKHAIVPGG